MSIKILSTANLSFRLNLFDQMEVSSTRDSQIRYHLLSAERNRCFQGTVSLGYFKNLCWIKMHLLPSVPVSPH